MLWFTLIHTFMGKGPKLADWSKSVCITPQSCLCRLLASNWELHADLSLNSFFISSVIISFVENNETNFPIEKHTLRVLYDNLKKIFAKFDSMLRLRICFNLLHFVSLLTIYAVAYCHTHLWITDQFGRLVEMSLYYTSKLFL